MTGSLAVLRIVGQSTDWEPKIAVSVGFLKLGTSLVAPPSPSLSSFSRSYSEEDAEIHL